MEMTDLQARIAENIKVLLATTGIRSQAALARGLGWEAAKVTRLLKGSQEWTLTDLVAVATLFGLDDPFLLARPLTELVGAVTSIKAAGGLTQEAHLRGYRPPKLTLIRGLSQVNASAHAPAQVA